MYNVGFLNSWNLLSENVWNIWISINTDLHVSITTSRVNCLLEDFDTDWLESMNWRELFALVKNLILLNIWNKVEVEKWFNWISHVWIFSWRKLWDHWYPDLVNFSFLLKWKGSIFKLSWQEPFFTKFECNN